MERTLLQRASSCKDKQVDRHSVLAKTLEAFLLLLRFSHERETSRLRALPDTSPNVGTSQETSPCR